MREIVVAVEYENVLDFSADVLILKHAQKSFGVDLEVVERLKDGGLHLDHELPHPGQGLIVNTNHHLYTPVTIFVGVPSLYQLDYPHVEKLGYDAVATVYDQVNDAKHIALTTHGSGFGLAPDRALKSLLDGIVEAIQDAHFPPALELSLIHI